MVDPKDLSPDYIAALRAVVPKRARTVIEEILAKGSVTTERLKAMGYHHPPRAAADVRELGIPLITTRVMDAEGRKVAAYAFADPGDVKGGLLDGRKTFSKELKQALIADKGAGCAVCNEKYADRYLQIDHRVPYRVGGDDADMDPQHFQLLCGSCNRAKSWSCENCTNYTTRDKAACNGCYWASPTAYEHVALEQERRLTLVWSGTELEAFDLLAQRADEAGEPLEVWIKKPVR